MRTEWSWSGLLVFQRNCPIPVSTYRYFCSISSRHRCRSIPDQVQATRWAGKLKRAAWSSKCCARATQQRNPQVATGYEGRGNVGAAGSMPPDAYTLRPARRPLSDSPGDTRLFLRTSPLYGPPGVHKTKIDLTRDCQSRVACFILVQSVVLNIEKSNWCRLLESKSDVR